MGPLVSFVVPCYNLAHLLRDCVNSILEQSYTNLEVIIMDDCSPDNTPEIASSFIDPRVRYVRNATNLRHLRNYNEGIRLSNGKYIWLISADDCLRSRDVLKTYVELLEKRPDIGYVFCTAVRLDNDGVEHEVLDYSVQGTTDIIWNGRKFLSKLIYGNTVVAPTALARKECYEKVSMFPLDMPWGGDWYLWCVFALHYNVAYFAGPMVYYRRHALSMTNHLMSGHVESCLKEDIELPWNIKAQAEKLGFSEVVDHSRRAIAMEYARTLATQRYATASANVTTEAVEQSLKSHAADPQEANWIRARMFADMGNMFYWRGEHAKAKDCYGRALSIELMMPKVWLQYALLRSGGVGIALRSALQSLRKSMSKIRAAY